MPNENEVEVVATEIDNEESETEETVTTETKEESDAGEKKQKAKRTPEEELAYFEGRAKRLRKDLGIADDEPKPKKETSKSSDLGEKAYLIANGIKGADEIAFVQKMKRETGKDVESLLETTYFQTEFKDFKEKKATANATPTGSKRPSNSSIDTVEYWIAKGELPPASEVELRRKVVNARMKKEESKGQFYNS